MTVPNLEILKKQFVGRKVTVDAQRPELSRMADLHGRVVAMNCNGRALVQFEGPDSAWYEIEPEYLLLEKENATETK